jgi:N-acetylmuramoyl-L-alanine amidase
VIPTWWQSPNFSERKGVLNPSLIIIHYTAMHDTESAQRALCNPETEVSSHYLISADGAVIQLVEERHRAWHAGISSWGNISDVNSHSIGIELANDGFLPFSAKLMESLEHLLGIISKRWNIPASRVLVHSDVSPGCKIDPGVSFDWRRLALNGLAVWAEQKKDGVLEENELMRNLGVFGYNTEVDFGILIAAFRLRFNPTEIGELSFKDCSLATQLALEHPVDLSKVST